MWRASVLVVASGIALTLLQGPDSGRQDPSHKTPEPAAAGQVASGAMPDAGVDAAQPVITVRGLCDEKVRPNGPDANLCNKVITRKEFESLMNALNPGGQSISAAGRQNLAQAYVEALAFVAAASKRRMDETEQFREVLYWARLRTIADLYRRNLQEEFRTPSPEEIDDYYQQHLPSFERVKLIRVLVPRESFSGANKDEFDKKALAAAQNAHQRVLRGDDPEQIQKDAYASLGLERPPATDLGTYRRADLVEKEANEVFSLQPGGVSQLETESKSYVIYKVASKETLKQAQVKAEITREISQQKYRNAIKAVLDSAPADFNEQYFGPMKLTPPPNTPVLPPRPSH